MGKFVDITGKRYGRLTVVRRIDKKGNGAYWECLCDCGNTTILTTRVLNNGHTKSCGCYRRSGERETTHGMSKTRIYREWLAIKRRCYNKNSAYYEIYGGRGIAVCDEWKSSFEAFYAWAMAKGYRDDLTIDRIDNNGDYSPLNCRWATTAEQSLNKSSNRLVTFNGETKPVKAWADEKGINYHTLYSRLYDLHWSVERALCT